MSGFSAYFWWGVVPGVFLALGIRLVFERLCSHTSLGQVILGWLALGATLAFGAFFLLVGIPMMRDPRASMGGAWTSLGAMLLLFALLCFGIGLAKSIVLKAPWWRTTGGAGMEATAGLVVGSALQMLIYPFSDLLRRGNRDTRAILDSFAHSREFFGGFELALAGALLILMLARAGAGKSQAAI